MNTNESSALSIEVRPDGVAVITYDVRGEPVNTIKASFIGDFNRALDAVASDPAVKAAILVSGKPDSFIAGADIEMIQAVKTAGDGEAICRLGHEAMARLSRSPKPIVAAVHGAALGGGFEIALACHARVLSDDKKTALGLPEVQLGLLPGMSGLQRLAALTSVEVALDHGLTGKNMRPAKAKALGVADDVVPAAILRDVAVKLALKLAEAGPPFSGAKAQAGAKKKGFWGALDKDVIARAALEKNPIGRAVMFKSAREAVKKKTGGHYPAPAKIVDVLAAFAKDGLEASQAVEVSAFGELVMSTVSRRLIEIFFATTALKKDTGVDDPNALAKRVERVAVIGAGLMGAGITYVTLHAGVPVRLRDRDDASLSRGLKAVTEILDERVKKRQTTPRERDQTLALLTTTTSAEGMRSADLVIEAVFEDLAVKHQVLKEAEATGKDGFIFATNTSSIPITSIAAAAKHPENVVGMHYFSPVQKMPLLEVIRTKETAASVVAAAVAFGKKQGKTVIVVNDGTGFYTSRILGPYMNEASWLLSEGVSVEAIDKALIAWGFPVGPIALLDEVGIDVAAHVGPIMLAAFGGRIEPPPTVNKLAGADRKGRKNERGFYLYGAAAKKMGKGKHVDESVYADLGLTVPDRAAKPAVSTEEIQMRCALQLVNEAMYCLSDGILRSPRDGDIGAIFGLGFPPFRGGPFRYVDSLGAEEVLKRMDRFHDRFGRRWEPAPALIKMAKSGGRFYG